MSFGLWVAFFWLAIIASRPVGYWFVNGTEAAQLGDGLGGSFIDRNTYSFLILLGIIALARRQIDWPDIISKTRWLWIFYFYLLFSTVWSDYPFVAFKRWFKDIGNVVMILIILTEKDPIEAMRSVFIRCAYVLITVSVLFIKYFPDLGRYYHRWTWSTIYCGVTNNKNSLGVLAMVSGLFLLWSIVDVNDAPSIKARLRKEWPDLLILSMCLWLLHMAESATSLGCFVLGSLFLVLLRLNWIRSQLRLLSWCGLGVALLLLAFTALPAFREVIAGALGRDVTLTGRTEIWQEVLKLNTNPVIGNGFHR